MSHGHTTDTPAVPPVPTSAGITNGVKVFLVFGILASIMQGAFTWAAAPYGRVWPAEASAKIDLPPAHLQTK